MSDEKNNFNLAALVLAEITRYPLRVLLYLAVMVSAIAVILSSHHNRQMLITHEHLMEEKDKLDVEWRHLVLEQGALTEHNRVEQLVHKQLGMRRPVAAEEVVVKVK